jgi:hypothetical protein
MDKTYAELLICLPVFTGEVFLIMLVTGTLEKARGDSFLSQLWISLKNLFKLCSRQKNRLKALLIIFVGVCAGTIINFMATEIYAIDKTFNDWIFKGMVQMSYIFCAAVAAVYIRDGYELKKVNDIDKQDGCDCNK